MKQSFARKGSTIRSILSFTLVSLFLLVIVGNAMVQGSHPGNQTLSRTVASTARHSSPLSPTLTSADFILHDAFNYTSIYGMESAGWVQCGDTKDSSYYSISPGNLGLINDGSIASQMCWNNIPVGVSNWKVSTVTSYEGGSLHQVQLAIVAGNHSYRALVLGVGGGAMEIFRDNVIVGTTPALSPRLENGTWSI